MAGGIGTRFWPMSTSDLPKQFHDVLGVGRTLLQQTYDRLLKITDVDKIYVITGKEYTDLVKKQLPDLGVNQIIAEPVGMNTAPCALYAAMKIHKNNPNAKMLLCPSDHLIINEDDFAKCALQLMTATHQEKGLYTLGIEPSRPDTGYGYIQYKEREQEIKQVKTFTEKPNLKMAESFIEMGGFLWNSGMFIWETQVILKSFEKYLPEMYQSMTEIEHYLNTPQEENAIKEVYPTLQKISIDKGIMEKENHVFVLPVDFGWNDLGTWASLYSEAKQDENKNAIIGKYVKTYNAQRNIICGGNDKALVIEGLEDYIVVDTDKALLICPLSSSQDVKNFVNDLKISKCEKFV